ncbi:MAG: hypothetical protein ACE5HN_07630, partial [Nitrospiria bacterium]
MLEEMRSLALDFLFKKLGNGDPSPDLHVWFKQIREKKSSDLLPFLTEAGEKIERVYILRPNKADDDKRKKVDSVTLDAEDFTVGQQQRLPFVRPSGSQSAAVGPILKRTFKAKEKEAGPSPKILETTRRAFKELAQSGKPWSDYFKVIEDILDTKDLILPSGKGITIGKGNTYIHILDAAVHEINEKRTVYLTVADPDGRWPGDHP